MPRRHDPAPTDHRATDDWTEQGCYEVADGVYRVPLPLPHDGLKAVNIYVLESDEGLLAVDGGWAIPTARATLERALRSVGFTVTDIRRFIVTHMHRDHYTQAVALRREFGAKVALGAGERESLEVAITPAGLAGQAQLDALGRAGASCLQPALRESGFGSSDADLENLELPDEWLSPERTVEISDRRALRIVATPGHTKGHLVFVEEREGLLFAGDHVLPHITPSIGFEPAPAHLPLGDYLDSLRRIRAMPDLMLLPAHGMPALSVHARIDELLQHHERRLQGCLDNFDSAESTAYQVACRLPWTSRLRTFGSLDPFNQMLAVCETAAHLDLLVTQGRLAATDAHGSCIYHK